MNNNKKSRKSLLQEEIRRAKQRDKIALEEERLEMDSDYHLIPNNYD